jgi:hypothetical protein
MRGHGHATAGNGGLIKANRVLFIGVSLTECLETNISGLTHWLSVPAPFRNVY